MTSTYTFPIILKILYLDLFAEDPKIPKTIPNKRDTAASKSDTTAPLAK
jgi:hypothetical protein